MTPAPAVHRHWCGAAADMRGCDVCICGRGEVPAAGRGMARDAGLAPAFLAVRKRREARKERTDEVSARARGRSAEEPMREQLRGSWARAGFLAQTQCDDVGECA